MSSARRSFAYELYGQIRKQADTGQNIMLAPTTLGSALSMILIGSRGSTKTQIMNSLFGKMTTGISDNTYERLIEAYADPFTTNIVDDEAKGSNSGLTLLGATKLYGEKSYHFDTTFIKQTKLYGSEMEEVDFVGMCGPVREHINSWVSEATDGNILNFFSPSDITRETELAIVSAVYFEGVWAKPFDEWNTKAGAFQKPGGKTIRTDFMEQTSNTYKTHFSRELDANVLEMPYKRSERHNACMILILPATSMESTEENLNDDNVAKTLSKLFASNTIDKTHLSLPKFKIAANYKLNQTLAQMGMTDVFSAVLADLSAMSSPDTRKRSEKLYLKTAVHKTVLKIDEKGAVGAGASGLVVLRSRSLVCEPRSFICNRPFLTLVYEKNSENVIFIGRVSDPSASLVEAY